MTKDELKEKIKCLEHNLQAYKKATDVQYDFLLKLNDLLIACGYSQKELNEYLMLNKLDSSYLLPPRQKIAINEFENSFRKELNNVK